MRIYLTVLFAFEIFRHLIGFLADASKEQGCGVIFADILLLMLDITAIIFVWKI